MPKSRTPAQPTPKSRTPAQPTPKSRTSATTSKPSTPSTLSLALHSTRVSSTSKLPSLTTTVPACAKKATPQTAALKRKLSGSCGGQGRGRSVERSAEPDNKRARRSSTQRDTQVGGCGCLIFGSTLKWTYIYMYIIIIINV